MRRRASLWLKVLLPVGLLIGGGAAARAQCPMEWKSGFGVPGIGTGYYYAGVYALCIFDDDGDGPNPPALYAGGDFYTAGDAFAQNIARWDGSSWSAVGNTLWGEVNALAVFDDDGPGPHPAALYAGCTTYGVQKWDGTSWSAVGWVAGSVYALTVFDDGTGPALYAGGSFNTADGVPVKHVARWDGSTWSALGSGIYSFDFTPQVRALAVYDDGSGPALYAAGHFSRAGDVELYNVARWDGSAWSMVGYYGTDYDVYALTVCAVSGSKRDTALYAGGWFTYAGYAVANGVAKWDGVEWSALDTGVGGIVYALGGLDDGTQASLYVGGYYLNPGGELLGGLARWDGANWSGVGSGLGDVYDPEVHALLGVGARTGPVDSGLYVGGEFAIAGGIAASHIARWDGSAFSALGSGNGASGQVEALSVFDDGTGPALYAGGEFATAGPVVTMGIARWDGSSWSDVGGGMDGSTYVSTVFDDGTGAALYVGGSIYSAGGVVVHCIAKWDGTTWSALGSGMNGSVEALGVFDDDGDGPHAPALYAGGYFTLAGGVPANRIAKWDGANWSALGSGLSGGSDPQVYALCAFDDSSGPALYVGGHFTHAGNGNVKHIARWNGTTWSDVGGGTDGSYSPSVCALTIFDDGTGASLYAGGGFVYAGGVLVNRIARWDGSNWSALGSGTDASVSSFAVLHDVTRSALSAGGYFTLAGGVTAYGVATWDGATWSAPADAPGSVGALAWCREETGFALYVGGNFPVAGASASAHIAEWACVGPPLTGDLNCDGVIDEFDIDPFVWALTDPGLYQALYPDCSINLADCNGDAALDAFDIDPFVDLLTGG
jgi:hypothetical protein